MSLDDDYSFAPAPAPLTMCEGCGEVAVATRGDSCQGCIELHRELEADDVWPVWLASLKGGAADMDAFSERLAGWKYVGADVRRGRNDKGVYIDAANDLVFLAPGHRGHLVFRCQDGVPLITILAGPDKRYPDWSASFSSGTPHEVILAACNAVIHSHWTSKRD